MANSAVWPETKTMLNQLETRKNKKQKINRVIVMGCGEESKGSCPLDRWPFQKFYNVCTEG